MEQWNLREEDKDTMVSAENYVLIKKLEGNLFLEKCTK